MPLKEDWKHEYTGEVDLTPWKYAPAVGAVLVAIVLGIYVFYADMSVVGAVEPIEKIVAALFMAGVFYTLYKLFTDLKAQRAESSES